MRFISKQMHSILDYPVALALISLPFILGLGNSNPLAIQLSVIVGIAALVLTLLTDHQTGLFKVVPYRVHLAVDFLVGLLFLAAPFFFGFEGTDAYFYWINGAAVLFVVALQKPQTKTS